METAFTIFTFSVMPAWLAMVIAPHNKWVRFGVLGTIVAMALGYSALMVGFGPGSPGGFGSLVDVREAFTVDGILLLGWVHYLCFDLFVGLWMATEAHKLGIHKALMAFCLVMTLMLGPMGLLFYLILRGVMHKRLLFVPGTEG